MALIAARGIGKTFGSRSILHGLDFDIEPRARLGVIGPNGGGKSTLLRILAGEEVADAGEVTQRRGLVVAFLPQQPEGDDRDAAATLRDARPDLAELEHELAQVERQLGEQGDDLDRIARLLRRQEDVLTRWTAAGGPGFEGRARALLVDVGLDDDDLAKPTRVLSGGQRKLVGLAACLLRDPDVLLLDEPEAHLDVEAREHLEILMRTFDGAVVAVSHDRYLLDETVTEIAELSGGAIRMWPGNYSAYTIARELEQQRQQQLYVTQQKEIARLEEAIRRFKDWANRVPDERHIKQARNKQRQIDRMEKIDRPVLERRKIALELRPHLRGGERVSSSTGSASPSAGCRSSTASTSPCCAANGSVWWARTAPASRCSCGCSAASSTRMTASARPARPSASAGWSKTGGPTTRRRRRSISCGARRRSPRERRSHG